MLRIYYLRRKIGKERNPKIEINAKTKIISKEKDDLMKQIID